MGRRSLHNADLSSELIIGGKDNFIPAEAAWLDLCGFANNANLKLITRVAKCTSLLFVTFCILDRDRRFWDSQEPPNVRLLQSLWDAGLNAKPGYYRKYCSSFGNPMFTCGVRTGLTRKDIARMRKETAAKEEDLVGARRALLQGFSSTVVCHRYGVTPDSLPGLRAWISRRINLRPGTWRRHSVKAFGFDEDPVPIARRKH